MECKKEGVDVRVAACILEPMLQGAGGMLFVDPLYQKCLVRVARSRGIPIIFDEVFSGLWRLGRVSAAELLGEQPDIACYAKLLTGSSIPRDIVYLPSLQCSIRRLLFGHRPINESNAS